MRTGLPGVGHSEPPQRAGRDRGRLARGRRGDRVADPGPLVDSAPRGLSGPRRPAIRWAIAAALVAAVLLIATPPGRSLAGALGELAGIGDAPTKPEIRKGLNSKAVVIGSGEGPNGVPFEVVASHSEETPARQPSADPGVAGEPTYSDDCAGLSVPSDPVPEGNPDAVGTRLCLTPALYRDIEDNPLTVNVLEADDALSDSRSLLLAGFALDPVDRVELSYRGPDGKREVTGPSSYALSSELAAALGAPTGFRFYVAFVDAPTGEDLGAVAESARARGYDQASALVATARQPGRFVPEHISVGSDTLRHPELLDSNLRESSSARSAPLDR